MSAIKEMAKAACIALKQTGCGCDREDPEECEYCAVVVEGQLAALISHLKAGAPEMACAYCASVRWQGQRCRETTGCNEYLRCTAGLIAALEKAKEG